MREFPAGGGDYAAACGLAVGGSAGSGVLDCVLATDRPDVVVERIHPAGLRVLHSARVLFVSAICGNRQTALLALVLGGVPGGLSDDGEQHCAAAASRELRIAVCAAV